MIGQCKTNGFRLHKIIFNKQKIKHLNEQMFPSNEYQLNTLLLYDCEFTEGTRI